MTIAATTVFAGPYSCNGSTVDFAFSFSVADYNGTDAEDQIEVTLETIATGAETVLTRGSSAGQYSVALTDGGASGGTVTTVSTYSSSYRIRIRRNPIYTQGTDLQNQGAYNAQTIEDQIDQMARQLQDLKDQVRRAPRVSGQAGTSFSGLITGPFTAGYGLVVSSDGLGWNLSAGALSGATVSAAMVAVVEAATLSAARTAFGLAIGTDVMAYSANPTFTTVNVGSTSTTLSELSPGVLGVEGVAALTLTGGTLAGDLVLPSAAAPSSIYSVGYRGTPTVSGNSAYAFPLVDAGSTIYHDEAGTRTWTIPANASVSHPIGTIFILDNTGNSGSAGTITLAITSDTLRRGDGTSGTGSRTIAAGQVASIRKVKSAEWVITGVFS